MSDLPQPTVPSVVTPQIDISKISEDVTARVSETVESKIAEATEKAAQTAAEKATANIAEKLVGKPQEEYAPKSWEQVKKDAAAEALKTVEEREKQQAEAKKAEEDNKSKQAIETEKTQYAQWDQQLSNLAEAEIIPKHSPDIQSKLEKKEKLTNEDLQQPSVAIRRKLFELAKTHPEDGNNLELIAYKYRNELTVSDEMPGANAPVFGAPKANTSTSNKTYTWEQLHNTPVEEL